MPTTRGLGFNRKLQVVSIRAARGAARGLDDRRILSSEGVVVVDVVDLISVVDSG
jgi:hypothetical protein